MTDVPSTLPGLALVLTRHGIPEREPGQPLDATAYPVNVGGAFLAVCPGVTPETDHVAVRRALDSAGLSHYTAGGLVFVVPE
jgi:hypothetical protein